MSPANRQRIIGLGLLVILLTILVPWALYVSDDLKPQLDASQPPAPSVQWHAIEPAVDDSVKQRLLADIKTQRTDLLSDEYRAANRLQSYALELEHFSEQDQADKQLKALNDAGYRGFTRLVDSTIVLYAGPEIEAERLQQVAKQLADDARFSFSLSNQVNYIP